MSKRKTYCNVSYQPGWGDAQHGNITEIGVDEYGKKFIQQHIPFQPVVYEKCENSDTRDFYGNSVFAKEINSLYEYTKTSENISNLYYCGDVKEHQQYIFKHYGDLEDFPIVPYVAYDIEILTSNLNKDGSLNAHGFPNIKEANEPVTVITAYYSDTKLFKTFGVREYTGENKNKYIRCADEKEMLIRFFDSMRDYVIISGWNISGFDNIYLISRCLNLGLNLSSIFYPMTIRDSDKLFKTRKIKMATGAKIDQEYVKMPGFIVLDYKDLFSKFYPEKLESYALDTVSMHILGDSKLDYHANVKNLDELYYKDFNTYVDYNIKDTLLVRDLEDKLGYLKLTSMLAYMTKSNFNDVEYPTIIWTNYIDNELLKLGIIPKRSRYSESQNYLGGYVLDSTIGKHKWVATFDVTSLYPSLYFRGGYSEMNLRYKNHDHSIRQSDDYLSDAHIKTLLTYEAQSFREIRGNDSISIAGYHFRREPDILCRLVKTAFMKKDEYSKLKKKATDKNEQDYYELMRYAIKIFINSFYGALANSSFRYYCLESARSITETGQYLVQKIAQSVNKGLGYNAILFSDTDSICSSLEPIIEKWTKKYIEKYSKNPDKKEILEFLRTYTDKFLQPLIDKSLADIETNLGFVDPGMEMGREKICDNMIVEKKKHYLMSIVENDGKVILDNPKILIKGIVIISTKTPKLLKAPLKNLCTILLQQDDEQEFNRGYHELLNSWKKWKIQDIALPSSIRGMKDYKPTFHDNYNISWVSGTPQHVRAGWLYNHLCKVFNKKTQLITDGMSIKYVFLKKNNLFNIDVIGFPNGDDLPPEFKLHDFIDYDRIWQKSAVTILDSLGGVLGYKSLVADKPVESILW